MSNGTHVRGRVALVTGANRGIGKAIVEALLARGAAKVYAGARNPETLAALIAASGGRVVPLRLDVTDGGQVQEAAAAAGDVDLLINNAGVAAHAFAAFEDPAWLDAGRREYETNALGTLRVTQAFAPGLAVREGGTVVNVVSVAAFASGLTALVLSAPLGAQGGPAAGTAPPDFSGVYYPVQQGRGGQGQRAGAPPAGAQRGGPPPRPTLAHRAPAAPYPTQPTCAPAVAAATAGRRPAVAGRQLHVIAHASASAGRRCR